MAGSFKIYSLQQDGTRIPAAGSIVGASSTTGTILTTTKDSYSALTKEEIALLYQDGIRSIYVISED